MEKIHQRKRRDLGENHLPDRGSAEQSAGFVQQEPAAH